MTKETYEHNGKLYRKVDREASDGGYIFITSAFSLNENYGNGDILRVDSTGFDGIYSDEAVRFSNREGLVLKREYEVLEEVGDVDKAPVTEDSIIHGLQREVASLRKDLRTFAEESTETAHELKALGKDVAKMDESIDFLDGKIAEIVEGMYAGSRKDFTPAERLQYAIASGASAEEVRSFYDGFTIAIVEYSDGLDSLAPGKLTELRELVAVYREFTKPLSKGSGGE